jgi:CRP-like cAMP-binding protein
MKLTQYVSLLSTVDDAIEDGRHAEALRLLFANFDRFDDNALLRERMAVALASCGRKKEAVEVWDHVARHWANAGFPTRSLAAIKQMQALRPDAAVLLDHFTALYNIRSPFLDKEAPVPTVPEPTEELILEVDEDGVTLTELLDRAYERASDTERLVEEPDALPALPLLSLLPSEALRVVLDRLDYEIFAKAEPILEAGQFCEDLIWTVTSDFVIEDSDPKRRLPSGALVGLSSFGRSASPARHSVFGQKNSELLRLDEAAIATLEQTLGDFHNRLATLRRHALTEGLLERHPMFAELSKDERVAIMRRFVGLRVDDGETLVSQREPSPGIFLVLDGQVDIVRSEDGWEITIATLSAGDVFGEVGVVSDNPAMAGCVMTSPGHLLFLARGEFSSVASSHPAIAKYCVNLANQRMAEVETTLSARDLAEVD